VSGGKVRFYGLARVDEHWRFRRSSMNSYRVLCEAAQDHDVLVAHFLLFDRGCRWLEKNSIDWTTVHPGPGGDSRPRYTMPAGSYLAAFSRAGR